ncbi:Ni/Co efflux regulator RcnB [Hydrogenophaga palleronii]|uniref:Ni/Co efflux regulator RcnB n=1 Tax=Hydrogenophaga palleronii TaxID=65655 RepID=A0ABU1WFS5_9BURK|nr:RcnB family protein [Hydrogenophaga palleronii]MDR7148094.1 Ni/Co efflux regulator RcnB [Hydrogenophaga palleronii]
MKSRNFFALAVAALTLGISSAALAQGPMQRVIRAEAAAIQHVDDRRGDRDDFRKDRRDDRRDHRADRRDDRKDHRADRREDRRDHRADRRDHRRDDRRDFRHGYYQPAPVVQHYYYHARGPEFRRGHYIPREYRNRQYVVVNHHHHRLTAPPRGHHWVQVGSDYVLIAVATGLIAHIILNN